MKSYREAYKAHLRRRHGKRSTAKHYVNDVDQFIKQVGEVEAKEVKTRQIDEFIDEQRAKGLASATINRRVAALHSFFEYIEGEEEIENPVKWGRHRVKEGKRLPRDASEQTVGKLLGAIEDERDKGMVGMMLGAGLRVGEVVALELGDVEKPRMRGESARVRVRGKGEKERIVWLTARWYGVLEEWLRVRPESETEAVFVNQHKKRLTVSGVQYRIGQQCARAEVKMSCHQLRHTFARRLAEQEMPTESIAQLLGHSNVSTTERYTAGADRELRHNFLKAMEEVESEPLEEVSKMGSVVLSGRVQRQQVQADPAKLQKELKRLGQLPQWLHPVLTRYVRQRWNGWQAHMAERFVGQLGNQLYRQWKWLVEEREIGGWEEMAVVDMEAWVAQRQAEGLKASTIRTQLATLKACLREAQAQGMPISGRLLRVKPPQSAKPLPRYLPAAQMQALQNVVKTATAENGAAGVLQRGWFLMLAQTGVRCCELLNLRLSDINFATQQVFVATGKNGDERIVYLTPMLQAALANYLAIRPSSEDDHLWLRANEARLTYGRVTADLRAWGESCNVAVTPHRLRHTFATQLINNGMRLSTLAKLLGHQTLNMTQRYATLYEHTVKAQFETAAANIDGILAIDWPQIAVGSHELELIVDSV